MFRKITVLFALALVLSVAFSAGAQTTATYDTVSIYDLQYVENPTTTDEETAFLGDTVVVKALVMHDVRGLWVGARWACFASDPDRLGEPWSGFFVIQNDTFAVNTNFQYLQTGDIAYFTGVLETYAGLTQLALLTRKNELVPVDVVSAGNPLPDPKVLTLDQLATKALAEQWESMLVRVDDARITNNNASSNQAIITDGTGQGSIDDYFGYFRYQFDDGTYDWPVNGTRVNVTGFVRDLGAEASSINPRDDNDVEVLSFPPVTSSIAREPGVPLSTDEVTVSAKIKDNTVVQVAKVYYSVNDGDFVGIDMTADTDTTFSAVIPAQANNSHVRYFIYAEDDEQDFSQVPGDTATFIYQYVVRDEGLNIKDVQYPWGYEEGSSPFRYDEVTLEGVVTVDTTDWVNNYYIQEKDSAWHAIWVYDPDHKPVKGDWVRITGTVQEDYGVTRLEDITSYEVVSQDYPFEPVLVNTGDITTGGDDAEAYESVLIKVQNLTVTNPFPDPSGNFGEFVIDDGTGGIRVDDAMTAFNGNLDSTFQKDDTIGELTGIHYYSYANYKILPRDTNDVVDHVSDIQESHNPIAKSFTLEQNYPNPFNPVTNIHFTVPSRGQVSLAVYNVLGQRIRTLFNNIVSPGNYQVRWNGRDDHGVQMGSGIYFYRLEGKNFSMTRKMILIK
ncbi:MAG: T9SS type A sorting domain-containing protein [Calditrichia bacterium]